MKEIFNPANVDMQVENQSENPKIKSLKNYLDLFQKALKWEMNLDVIKTGEERGEERGKKTKQQARDNFLNNALLCKGILDKGLLDDIIPIETKESLRKKASDILNTQSEFARHRMVEKMAEGYVSTELSGKEKIAKSPELLIDLIKRMNEVLSEMVSWLEKALEKENESNDTK